MPRLSSFGGRRLSLGLLLLQCLLLLALTLLTATAAAAAASNDGSSNGRLHPPGWYLVQFRRWARAHNVSLPYDADGAMGRAFRRRLAIWSENK